MKQHTSNRTKIKQNISIGCALFLFFILLQLFFATFFSSLIYTVAQPFWNTRNAIFGKSTDTLETLQSKTSLISDIKSLQEQLYTLQLKNLELSAQVVSIATSTYPLVSTRTTNRIIAKVISKPPYSMYDSFVLGQGSTDGIALGAKVYIGDNSIVGTITEVQSFYSKVTLFSSGGTTSHVNILRTGQGISLVGGGGGNFTVLLPKDLDVVQGDFFVDPSVSQSIVAKVYSIDVSSLGSFKKIYARIPFNILQTNFVEIEKL